MMAQELEVSRRTVMRDLAFMRDDLGAPIEYDGEGFVYSQPHWSMPNIKLTEGDLLAVCIAEKAIAQFGDSPFADTLRNAFEKITAALPDAVEVDSADLAGRYDFTMSGIAILPPGVLSAFQQGITENRQIRMTYLRANHGDEKQYTIEPYLLLQREGAWYAAARDAARQETVPLFNLSRVKQHELLASEFEYILSDFDADEYLRQMGATYHGTQKRRVVIDFTGPAAFYVAERIWYPTQKTHTMRDGRLRFEVTVPHLWDIIPWILRWGSGATAVSPKELTTLIADEARAMSKKYCKKS
jgi:predicted DNA-binding transcriptional regulator YafY